MNNSAAKVGEIFREAGTAFNKLSEMTLMFQPTEDSPTGGKWSEEEVELLRGCVNRFAVELNKISGHIKNRTMSQLKRLLDIDSGVIHVIHQEALQPFQQQLQQQHNHEVYYLSWANNQILANGLPLNQQFNDLCMYLTHSGIPETPPMHQVEDDILPDLGAIEFGDTQESDEFDFDLSGIIKFLDENIDNDRVDTSSQAVFGTLHAVLPQNYGYPEPPAGDYWQQMNQNIIPFNIQENFNVDQLQKIFCLGTAAAPVAESEQCVINKNIFNNPPLSSQNISYDYPSFGLPFVQAFVRPDEKASALPAGNEIISPETQHRPQPEAAPAPQTGAFSFIDRNNRYENYHLKIDNKSIYAEPDIKNVVFPGPFSPLNKYITNCNPHERKASIEHDDKTQVTDETDPPANSFWKLKSSVPVPWEDHLSSCDFDDLFERAKRDSIAKARSAIEQRRRGRPAESAQSRKKSRGSGGRKKVTVTTPGPVTRSQTRRLRSDSTQGRTFIDLTLTIDRIK